MRCARIVAIGTTTWAQTIITTFDALNKCEVWRWRLGLECVSMAIRIIVRDGDVGEIQLHCCIDATCKAASVSAELPPSLEVLGFFLIPLRLRLLVRLFPCQAQVPHTDCPPSHCPRSLTLGMSARRMPMNSLYVVSLASVSALANASVSLLAFLDAGNECEANGDETLPREHA